MCISSVDNLHGVPDLKRPSANDVSLHLALCEEWIREDALSGEFSFRAFKVVEEDQDVCIDWRASHMSLVDVFSSMIISAYTSDTNYSPKCDKTQENHGSLFLNFTTIQQSLGTFTLMHEVNIVSVEKLKEQCKRCLLNYDPQIETTGIKSNGFHHCFAWPEDHDRIRNIDIKNIPHFTYIENDLRQRASFRFENKSLYHQSSRDACSVSHLCVSLSYKSLNKLAKVWKDSAKPPMEKRSGVVYWLDPTTVGMKYDAVLAAIPNVTKVTSISILAGPDCATALLPTGQGCHEYGEGLERFLAQLFPSMITSG